MTTTLEFPRGDDQPGADANAWNASQLGVDSIQSRAAAENFPVAMRWLPAALREELLAIYGFARLVDQIGDEVEGDRLSMLDALSADVARIGEGEVQNAIVSRLAPVVLRHGLPIDALERLIEANRRDQTLERIATWAELMESCTYSANPVGELVLGLFNVRRPRTIETSNAVCSALQVVEHCQDVIEDLARNRVYLPAQDLERFGCRDGLIISESTSLALRCTIHLQVQRARELLAEADTLLAELPWMARILVAGYAAGGLATCDALERHGYDVATASPRPTRRNLVVHWIVGLVRASLQRGARR